MSITTSRAKTNLPCHDIATITQWYSKLKRKNRFAKNPNALNLPTERTFVQFLGILQVGWEFFFPLSNKKPSGWVSE
jgi:hypothetical protein